MAKGLPKSIIKKYGISKKAWRVFRGRKKRPRSRVSNPKTKRRKRKMGRRKRRGGGKSLQQQVFKWLRIGALVAPGAIALTAKGASTEEKLSYALAKYTGYESWNKKFNFQQLVEGYGPFLATTLVTYGIPKLAGIIRRL